MVPSSVEWAEESLFVLFFSLSLSLSPTLKNKGEWVNDERSGTGTYISKNGDRFDALSLLLASKGKRPTLSSVPLCSALCSALCSVPLCSLYSLACGRYEGKWRNNKKHGKGQMLYADGDSVAQWYDNGKLIKEEGDSDDDYTDSD